MNKFMQIAIKEAYRGINQGDGGPFGSVVVKDGKIVGTGHNMVLKENDPTLHGEIMAIKDACKNLSTFDLSGCEIYTTSEPCPMCLGAIMWSNIDKVYAGCNVKDAEDIGFRDQKFYDSLKKKSDIQEECDRADCLILFADYKEMKGQADY